MCLLCGKEVEYQVIDCWWFDGTEMQDFTVYLCSDHGQIYKFLHTYDTENPNPSSYANLLVGMSRVGPMSLINA
jgi:hypothetical protein